MSENPNAFPLNAGEFGIEPSPGMTLRDYFAGQALAGLASRGLLGPDQRAQEAYDFADAMLAERSK